MIGNGTTFAEGTMSAADEIDNSASNLNNYCRDFIRGCCTRDNCRYIHELPAKSALKGFFVFCHDFQNKGCFRNNCRFVHCSAEEEQNFYDTGRFPRDPRNTPVCQAFLYRACTNQDCKFIHPLDVGRIDPPPPNMNVPPPPFTRPVQPMRDDDSPPEPKMRRFMFDENAIEQQCLPPPTQCLTCDTLDHKVKLLHDNISVLLKKVADLTEKNVQLTSMNEFLLEQTASLRSEQSCVITSRHGTSAPVSLATVSVTPVVSLAGAIPALVPTAATPNLALGPAASRAQLLPASQILTVSTTQQLMGNSGTLIVTSAGAQQLMQVSDSGTLMGGGQTVVAVTPAQLTLAQPTQQLISSAPTAVVQQQLVQQSGQLVQPQLTQQHQANQFAAQQSVQHLAAQQSAQHLAAQQSAQHLVQQSAQHLAAQQSAQRLAAQQNAQHLAAAAQQSAQQLAAAAQQSAQQLVHQTSTQQITISSTSQPMALPNSQAQPMTFPMISQSILPH